MLVLASYRVLHVGCQTVRVVVTTTLEIAECLQLVSLEMHQIVEATNANFLALLFKSGWFYS